MTTPIGPHGQHMSLGPRRKLTIIIPCFNERGTVLDVLARVMELPIDKAILVVDNCSTDGTREALADLCDAEGPGRESGGVRDGEQRVLKGPGFTVVLQPSNQQKGTSVRLGIALADSDYLICQDADLEYDPSDIVRLIAFAERTGADAVFGSRFVHRPLQLDGLALGRSALTAMFRALYGSRVTDVATCYKLMRSSAAKSLDLQSTGFDLDFEIAAKLRRAGYAISEIPVTYRPRSRKQGKKLRWLRDGVRAARALMSWVNYRGNDACGASSRGRRADAE
jgi:dolichol-phosphate mannosyltransferase